MQAAGMKKYETGGAVLAGMSSESVKQNKVGGLNVMVLMPSLKELVSADYQAVKDEESETIIRQSLSGFQPVETPMLLQVSGIPGAGKSTFCQAHLPKNFVWISFDKIMLSLASYQREAASLGLQAAYKNNEMRARIIGYELLGRALAAKLNVMLEHSGTNKAHLELMAGAKALGYKTAVDFIVCDTGLAIKRAEARAKKINRYVPEKLIYERAAGFREYVEAYKKLASEVKLLDGANNFRLLKEI